jgi:hypothetical protein
MNGLPKSKPSAKKKPGEGSQGALAGFFETSFGTLELEKTVKIGEKGETWNKTAVFWVEETAIASRKSPA